MNERRARWAAAAALVAVLAASILLAGGLGAVPFHDGRAFDEKEVVAPAAGPSTAGSSAWSTEDLLLSLVPIAAVLSLVLWSVLAKKPAGGQRRTTWRIYLGVAFGLIALAFAAHNRVADRLAEDDAATFASAAITARPVPFDATLSEPDALPEAGEAEARATSALLFAAFGTIAVVAVAAIAIPALRREHREAASPATASAAAAGAAHAALDGLRFGRDAAGVVEVCYRDVMRALAQAAGQDARALTPREFALRLASAGYGGPPLVELTELFELVRYGGRPDALFAARARACFAALADPLGASGATAKG